MKYILITRITTYNFKGWGKWLIQTVDLPLPRDLYQNRVASYNTEGAEQNRKDLKHKVQSW